MLVALRMLIARSVSDLGKDLTSMICMEQEHVGALLLAQVDIA